MAVGAVSRMDQTPFPAGPPLRATITFGPFCLHPHHRRLFQDSEPLQVGSRALEILIALTERVGELVTKDELIARAWSNATVEESNLRVQVALLRKVLGDTQTVRAISPPSLVAATAS